MIHDLSSLQNNPFKKNYDVCIAGAGVAGIILALRIARQNKSVLLIEAGGFEYSSESQNLYEGQNVGFQYFHLDVARLRYLGGTSNHWGGWCRPLEPVDFTGRTHIPDSKWPIDKTDLDSYMDEALEIFGLQPFEKSELSDSQGLFNNIEFRFSNVRFKDKYYSELKKSPKIDLVLNANVTDIKLTENSTEIDHYKIQSYEDEGYFIGRANSYILALGGIENARALLNAENQISTGIGNQSDLVGRYFMEHLHYDVGYFVANPEEEGFFDDVHFMSPTKKLINRAAIANIGFRLQKGEIKSQTNLEKVKGGLKDIVCASDILKDFLFQVRGTGVLCSTLPKTAGSLRAAYEQVPNSDSRVKLSTEKDRFGLAKVILDWRLSPQDKRTIREGSLELAKYFIHANLGRIKLNEWILAEEDLNFPSMSDGEEVAGYHHMGTTRMGSSEQEGVVDRNCKVFGVDNFYIAGSSVFRTAGHANPTFTIAQLALRLGDHVGQLRTAGS